MQQKKSIVVIGASRQTLTMVARLKKRWKDEVEIYLIHHHSFWLDETMAKEIISGTYGLNDIRIDLPPYLERLNCHFILDHVASLLIHQKKVLTDSGRLIQYDIIIFGDHEFQETFSEELPLFGHYFIKPSYIALEIKNEIETLIELNQKDPLGFVILGGGHEGVTYALQLEALLRKRQQMTNCKITIVEAKNRLLPHLAPAASAVAKRFCQMSNIEVLTETHVEHIQTNRIVLTKGQTRSFDLVVRTYHEGVKTLFEKAGLMTDDQGRVLTNAAFQVEMQPNMFAIGNCGCIDSKWTYHINPKLQMQIVLENISAVLNKKKLKKYQLNQRAVTALPLGKDYGLLVTGKKVFYGKWCLRLMHWQNQKSFKQIKKLAG